MVEIYDTDVASAFGLREGGAVLSIHCGSRGLGHQIGTEFLKVRSPSYRGVGEEAPGAYKDVTAVVDAADQAGLSRKVAKLSPMVCVKG